MNVLIPAVLVFKDSQAIALVVFLEMNSMQDYHFYNLELVFLHVTLEDFTTIKLNNVNNATSLALHVTEQHKIVLLVVRLNIHSFIKINA